jgi:hypothetical protein
VVDLFGKQMNHCFSPVFETCSHCDCCATGTGNEKQLVESVRVQLQVEEKLFWSIQISHTTASGSLPKLLVGLLHSQNSLFLGHELMMDTMWTWLTDFDMILTWSWHGILIISECISMSDACQGSWILSTTCLHHFPQMDRFSYVSTSRSTNVVTVLETLILVWTTYTTSSTSTDLNLKITY